jgi:hypothetical protein
LLAVQHKIAAGNWRESAQAKEWAGNAVAEVLGLDFAEKGARDRVKRMLAIWIQSKALKVTTREDKSRRSRKWIEVNEWAYQPGEHVADDYGRASGQKNEG